MDLLNTILISFESCFTEPAFRTFLCTILGFILRTDNRGMASFVRALHLAPSECHSFAYFFKSAQYSIEKASLAWCRAVASLAPLKTLNGSVVLIGDGVKASKEGRRMVGVKKLHQESENSSKGEFIHGHMFGGVGILAGGKEKLFSIPLSLRLHDGIKPAARWSDELGGHLEGWRGESHVVQMVHQSFEAAEAIGKNAILLLDRYFPTVPAFAALEGLNERVHIVSKMKASAVAYEAPPAPMGKRGRPRVKGERVKLGECFDSRQSEFRTAKAALYGEEREVGYLVLDLLWGQGFYKKLRFVLVEYGGARSILVATDLGLTGLEVMELYGFRFKVECTFRELKQIMDAFGYRFWNKRMPKLNRYKRKDEPDALEGVTEEATQLNLLGTLRAMEMFSLCACIALGSLQMCSLRYGKQLKLRNVIYLRSYGSEYAYEATMADLIRNQYYRLLGKPSDLAIMKKINHKQRFRKDESFWDEVKSA